MSAMNYVCEVLATGFGSFWFLRDPLLLARVVKSADAVCSREITAMGMDGLPSHKSMRGLKKALRSVGSNVGQKLSISTDGAKSTKVHAYFSILRDDKAVSYLVKVADFDL